ncbi:peptidylprolyl isomerase, partial [Acinetobacter baumannii]|uniref:peptidylprolyl isomerase n=1 Tax=Acinetobacter baumannii TaxID=470 RepID=UPI003AF9B879
GVSSHSVWAKTLVEMQTNLGKIEIELYDDKAPMSVNNFKGYIKSGFYKETIFHRVIPGFMAQGGVMTTNMQEKTTREPIKNEAGYGIANTRGTLAMART